MMIIIYCLYACVGYIQMNIMWCPLFFSDQTPARGAELPGGQTKAREQVREGAHLESSQVFARMSREHISIYFVYLTLKGCRTCELWSGRLIAHWRS